MNNHYVFLYSVSQMWKLDIWDRTKKISKIKLYIDEEDENHHIRRIRTTIDNSIICIIVQQSEKENFMVIWDLDNDKEKESFDCNNDALFLQD